MRPSIFCIIFLVAIVSVNATGDGTLTLVPRSNQGDDDKSHTSDHKDPHSPRKMTRLERKNAEKRRTVVGGTTVKLLQHPISKKWVAAGKKDEEMINNGGSSSGAGKGKN